MALRGSRCEVQGSAAEFGGSHVSRGIGFLLMGKDTELSLPSVSHIVVEIILALPAFLEHLILIPSRLLGYDHSSLDM